MCALGAITFDLNTHIVCREMVVWESNESRGVRLGGQHVCMKLRSTRYT